MLDQNGADAAAGISSSRALVVRSESAATSVIDERPTDDRPMADFLAQLIACDRRLPAYRRARTVEPGRAVSAYGGRIAVPTASLDCSV